MARFTVSMTSIDSAIQNELDQARAAIVAATEVLNDPERTEEHANAQEVKNRAQYLADNLGALQTINGVVCSPYQHMTAAFDVG